MPLGSSSWVAGCRRVHVVPQVSKGPDHLHHANEVTIDPDKGSCPIRRATPGNEYGMAFVWVECMEVGKTAPFTTLLKRTVNFPGLMVIPYRPYRPVSQGHPQTQRPDTFRTHSS
jgi:hypothetical protein